MNNEAAIYHIHVTITRNGVDIVSEGSAEDLILQAGAPVPTPTEMRTLIGEVAESAALAYEALES